MNLTITGDAREIEIFFVTYARGLRAQKADQRRAVAKAEALHAASKPTPEAIEKEILEMIQAGGIITAIRRHRAITGVGLKESKDYVEALRGRFSV